LKVSKQVDVLMPYSIAQFRQAVDININYLGSLRKTVLVLVWEFPLQNEII